MPYLDTIQTLIIAYSPAIIALLGIILAIIKIVKVVNDIKADNKASEDSIQNALQSITKENTELKKKVNRLLSQLDHIRGD